MPDFSPFSTIQRKSLYQSVKDEILLRIRTEQWTVGSVLPNEIELAKLFGVSQGTVRRALKELVDDGLLVRRQGKGTYVNDYGRNRDFTRRQFQRFRPDREGAWQTTPKLVLFEEIPASMRVARALEITPTMPVIHLRRELVFVLARQQQPGTAFDEIWLPRDVFPRLTREMIDVDIRSIYGFYQHECDVTVTQVEDTAKAVLLNPEQAAVARVPLPCPAIRLERVSRNVSGRAVEYRIQTAVTEGFHLVFF
ncbi:GntR family transcriptional regulator [Sutterella sp.]|uniref:GntR family transcriptional regulator n=1 Tax=Sutterella sp. TaxID=1981025 RepID=UPI0026E02724|nr:GntR family transcriptional regulator [Sutterella sp.]MDO5530881.1 GntR family transcriptional regulator [Sutterella sp.]